MEIFNPKLVSKFPIIAGVLFFTNSMSQIVKIWADHSSKDQSLIGWVSLTTALFLFLVFYKVCCPDQKYAFWATIVEILTNLFLILSVIIFK